MIEEEVDVLGRRVCALMGRFRCAGKEVPAMGSAARPRNEKLARADFFVVAGPAEVQGRRFPIAAP